MIGARVFVPLAFVACALGACTSSSNSSSSQNDGGSGDGANQGGPGMGSMSVVTGFGSNPGALAMYAYVPAGVPASAPLVVAMHGCTQSAADYVNAGWNDLADEEKFYVVYPQQSSANNLEECFDWFQDEDATRDSGEALSIKQMVDWMKSKYSIDASRVFATGLSAGGAMTSVMLSVYPDVFAAGAVMSGVPYGCAHSAVDALSCTNPGKTMAASDWGAAAKAGDASFSGPYPRLSVWQGEADTTVNPSNAANLVTQWAALTGISQTAAVSETVDGATHTEYEDGSGRVTIERYSIPGMNHGAALDPKNGCGVAASYMLDAGICSTALAWSFFTGEAPPKMTHAGK